MANVLYAPIHCAQCDRRSFCALSVRETQKKLKTGEPIELHCGFDEHVWIAEARERTVFARLLMENERVESCRTIRLPDIGHRSFVSRN